MLDIELLLILRDYHRKDWLGRFIARQMFPVLEIIHISAQEIDKMIARHYEDSKQCHIEQTMAAQLHNHLRVVTA